MPEFFFIHYVLHNSFISTWVSEEKIYLVRSECAQTTNGDVIEGN